MADRGHELTDEILNRLETRIAEEYAVATRDMQRKFRVYMEKFTAEDEVQKALLDAGKITKKEYSDWRYRHMMMGKRWEAMKDVLAQDLAHASDIALKIAGEKMADVYALNANFATYQIEHDAKIDTGFTLYNHDTAEYLLEDERQLMPGPSTKKAKEIAANKAMQWDKQKVQSAVLQGVLQGEGPRKVAARLRQVGQMGYNASVRYARTMTTSAQNAGRYNSFRRAKNLGVDLTIEWMATLDSRTRHAHRLMHGRRTTVDEPFRTPDGFTIYYPADCTGMSTAPQKEIWNCRCTLRAMVKGYERETIKESPKMGDMTFEEWQQEKAPKPKTEEESQAVPEVKTFKDRVNAIKNRVAQNGGVITEKDLKDAGSILADEFNSAEAERNRLIQEETKDLEIRRVEAHNEYLNLRNKRDEIDDANYDLYKKGNISLDDYWKSTRAISEQADEARAKWRAIDEEIAAIRKKYALTAKQQSDWLASKIGEIRDVGGSGLDLKGHLMNSRSRVVDDVIYAYNRYPKDWVEASVKRGVLNPRVSSRGYYSDVMGEIRISGSGNSAIETAFHELGHRFERAVDGIKKAEKEFYDRRTDGEPLVLLSKIFPRYGYKNTEKTRKDNFLHAYMGKDYGGSSYELVSMGFEDAYMNPANLAKDRDMQEWIYGLLLLR